MNQSPSIPELNDRAREVFRQIVDSYLASGAPVGSRTLSKLGALGLSPASIRNVMQDLEELGLLAAPHVSAGRQPTELGLRLFVDGMMQAAAPSEAERAAIEQPIQAGTQLLGGTPMTDLLTRTTAVLSGLSACAGLVLVPKAEPVLRQINFVTLAPRKALAILVGADGSVENRVLDLPADLPATVLIEAANYINARLSGLTLSAASAQLAREIADDRAAIDALTATLVEAGLASWSADGAARPVLIVRGQAHLLDDGATDLERVRLLLDDIEG
ncbi:MAG: HrcA family transcriptional regulator, partial [Polymorphobacter sp.]